MNRCQGHIVQYGQMIEQIEMLEILQKVDVGLLVAFPAYEDRKRHLEWYKTKLEEDK